MIKGKSQWYIDAKICHTQKNSKVSVTTEIDAMLTAIIQMGANHK